MIIKITEAAIEHLQKEGLFDRESAEELLQSLISLCIIGEGSPGIHPIDPILLSRVYEMSRSLGKVIEGLEALNRKGDIPEGEGSETRLRKAVKEFREAFIIAVGDRSPFAKEALRRIDEALRPRVDSREEGE